MAKDRRCRGRDVVRPPRADCQTGPGCAAMSPGCGRRDRIGAAASGVCGPPSSAPVILQGHHPCRRGKADIAGWLGGDARHLTAKPGQRGRASRRAAAQSRLRRRWRALRHAHTSRRRARYAVDRADDRWPAVHPARSRWCRPSRLRHWTPSAWERRDPARSKGVPALVLSWCLSPSLPPQP